MTFTDKGRHLANITCVVGATILSQGVSATPIDHTFDFTASPAVTTQVAAQPLSITSDNGLVASVTGTGRAPCTPPCITDGRLKRDVNGVGVFDSQITNNEAVTVSINPEVGRLVEAVVFEFGAGVGDTLDVYVDDLLVYSIVGPNFGASNTIDFSSLGFSGSVFKFVGVDTSRLGSPAYALTSLKVSVGDENGGPVVPEPATLALFGLGLAGIGALRRRKLTT